MGRPEVGVDENTLVLWSTLFYLLENFATEITAEQPELESNLQQLCFAMTSQTDLPRPLYICLLTGLERLVVAGRLVAYINVIIIIIDILIFPGV